MSQMEYFSNVNKISGLDSAKHAKTPMSTTLKLTKDDIETPPLHTLYLS